MDTIYCLVDAAGRVYLKDGAESYRDVATAYGLNDRECGAYRFDLTTRRLLSDRGSTASAVAVRAYLDARFGTPEKLIAFAQRGSVSKQTLASVLAPLNRQRYISACAAVEKRYTEDCTATGDPCLESGCAVEGETCLEPLMRAGIEYHKACAAEWIKEFQDPRNRIGAWVQ